MKTVAMYCREYYKKLCLKNNSKNISLILQHFNFFYFCGLEFLEINSLFISQLRHYHAKHITTQSISEGEAYR
jgi:hypothetical protein